MTWLYQNPVEAASRILDEIFNVLEGSKSYCLSENDLHRIKYLSKTNMYTLDKLPEKLYLKNQNSDIVGVFEEIIKSPQVIDAIPIMVKGEMSFLNPVVILPSDCSSPKDVWVITHELVHLLSVGPYIHVKHSPDLWLHSFGLNSYGYSQSGGECITVFQKEKNILNEIFNDAVTWHMVEAILGSTVEPPDVVVKKYSHDIKNRNDINFLIGCYFSGQSEKIIKRISIK